MNKALIFGGAALLLLFAYEQSQAGTGVTNTTTVPSNTVTPLQVPAILNGGVPSGNGGTLTGGNGNLAPLQLAPSGGGIDIFDWLFNQVDNAKQSYRQEYPVAPGVIDAAAVEN